MKESAMNERKEIEERLNREYGWFWKRLGKGKMRYFLLGLMNLMFLNLLLILPALMFSSMQPFITKSIILGGSIGLFLNLMASMRLRYWRDFFIWRFGTFTPIAFELLIVGFILISNQPVTLLLAMTGCLISISLAFHDSKREAERWELARRKGFLRRYLDEENWMFDNDPIKMSTIKLDLAATEKTVEQQKNSLKRLMWLEKLHFLIPAIMIAFRRAFGHETIILGALFITFGMMFVNSVQWPLYLKICEWEKEKGKPILLREIWEKDQQQRKD